MRNCTHELDALYQYNKEQEADFNADTQHCHSCAYWSEPNETEKEPRDSGECQNPWERKQYGKRPRGRWCPAWSREYDYPENHITEEDKRRAKKI